MRVAIVTVSDSQFGSERQDTSGDAIRDWCSARGYEVAAREHVVDETSQIVPLLAVLCDSGGVDLVLHWRTGLSPRDVTPRGLAVIEREAGYRRVHPCVERSRFPRAALSRGVAGLRGKRHRESSRFPAACVMALPHSS